MSHIGFIQKLFRKYRIDEDGQQDCYLAILLAKRLLSLTTEQQRGYIHNLVRYVIKTNRDHLRKYEATKSSYYD